MAAFRWHGAVRLSVPKQNRFAQSRSGGNQRQRLPLLRRLAGIENFQLVGPQPQNAIGCRFEIIEQLDAGNIELLGDVRTIDNPRQIGGLTMIVDDRPRDAEAGSCEHDRLLGRTAFVVSLRPS